MKIIEFFLAPFDNEENELIVRHRIFMSNWFPYRTIEFLGYDEENNKALWGKTEWNRPDKFRKK